MSPRNKIITALSTINELSSNQEETVTKLCLHTLGYVIVRNHSGDVDINAMLIAKVILEPSRVILDIHMANTERQ